MKTHDTVCLTEMNISFKLVFTCGHGLTSDRPDFSHFSFCLHEADLECQA